MTQPAERDAVQFTRESATRIANVVRTVELGVPKLSPLMFAPIVQSSGGGGKVFKICTFTGAWSKNSTKVVVMKYHTTTPNTVTAMNVFVGMTATTGGNCAIARYGTAWFLIQAECN